MLSSKYIIYVTCLYWQRAQHFHKFARFNYSMFSKKCEHRYYCYDLRVKFIFVKKCEVKIILHKNLVVKIKKKREKQ